jgi:murein L,D-transpeptidase YcbB/YkuD
MSKKFLLTFVLIMTITLVSKNAFSSEKTSHDHVLLTQAGEFLKGHFSAYGERAHYTPGGEHIYTATMLKRFYQRRNFRPAWSDNNGLLSHAEPLVEAIKEVNREGLIPEFYHFEKITALLEQVQNSSYLSLLLNVEALVELDLLLTDAFLLLGCHFSAGCVNPVTFDLEWFTNRDDLNVDAVLEDALKENSVRQTLSELLLSQGEYHRLKETLFLYREISRSGGWSPVYGDIVLKNKVESSQIVALKKRLFASGDLDDYKNLRNGFFDNVLERAVMRFQKRHGLEVDGTVGPLTRDALNVSAEARVRQIEVNLERMRWTARNLGHRYIIVNIADFKSYVIEHGRSVLSMDVVVGKPFWNTPIFTDKMTYIVLNPSWNIPESIAKEEILPKIQEDPNYLENQNIKVLTSWSKRAREIPPETINWSERDIESFPYKFRQNPGPLNPLGRIKFLFPNKFKVYLHDTPARGQFSRNIRAFSHGCIRIKRPLELAEYLLRDDPEWTRENILSALESEDETEIHIKQPITIHIVYLTAWVDEQGILNFRSDIYGRDEQLSKALKQRPPQPFRASKK